MTDYDFAWANYALPWRFEQELPDGRRLGAYNQVPAIDYRIDLAIRAGVDFRGKRVLEPGFCEGHITVGLLRCGAEVTGFDARMANLLKATCRCAAWGFSPRLHLARADDPGELAKCDILFHSGLLYHLPDPVTHFRKFAAVADLVILDTHTAKPDAARETSEGFEGHWWTELGGPEDMLAGLQERSFWLTKESLALLFDETGFAAEVLKDDPGAPYGPRSLYLLKRKAA